MSFRLTKCITDKELFVLVVVQVHEGFPVTLAVRNNIASMEPSLFYQGLKIMLTGPTGKVRGGF